MTSGDEVPVSLDAVVARLQALRTDASLPSFGDIAIGVSRIRRERGLTHEQSRVGSTTVYDAFRTGRRRLDSDLVSDIVRALGGGEGAADDLAAQCRAAQSGSRAAPTTGPTVEAEPRERVKPSGRIIVLVVAASLVMNLLGLTLSEWLDLPVYLDMIGTVFSAIVLGPWWGVLVGVVTNIGGTAASGPESLLFAPVKAVGALVWGYGTRRWRLGRSIPRFFALNVLVAVRDCSGSPEPA